MTVPLTDVHVVTHTHWDREWYHTAERFRQRLVVLVDELLDDPPPAGSSFLLDGQAIVVEDYLEVRPERAAELGTLLQQRRLEAGPWYVLADTLIPDGEALVRNLRLGIGTMRRMRAVPPAVLYCPDSFGHPAVLPDIAAGFGMTAIVLWRGLGGRRWPPGDTMRWRGAAGACVLAIHLPPDGYEFGNSLPVRADEAAERWRRISALLGARSTTGSAVLLNGADHHARQRGHARALGAIAAAAAPVRVHASSLDEAARAMAAAATLLPVPEISGELRDSYGYTWTLQGTLAARAAQKRANALTQRLLVRDVEPWLALQANVSGAGRALLTAAWKTLLQAHPHDTLCGTSIDAVAQALDARVAAADVQARGLRDDHLHALIGHDSDAARVSAAAWRPVVVIRNAAARPRGGVVELTLLATRASIAVGPGSALRQGARRPTAPLRVEGAAVQILSRRERVALTESPRSYPDACIAVEADAVGWVEPMDGYSVVTRLQGAHKAAPGPKPVACGPTWLDNGRVRIDIDPSGRVGFTDLVLGRRLEDVITLERHREAGDLYTPAPRERIEVGAPGRVRLVRRGPLRGELAIDFPSGGRRHGAGGPCRIAFQVDAGSHALRMVVRGVNRCTDHRLRLRVDTRIASVATIADAAFLPVARTPQVVTHADEAMERVVPTAPLHRWVARFAGDEGVALVSDGLAEYESRPDGAILVTLLRAVGQLSRADLAERPGHAGWPADTPLAQSIGPYSARLALRLFGADAPAVREAIEHFAEDELVPLVGETLRSNLLAPRIAGGLALEGAGLAFSAAMPAERDGWIVLRCVNLRDTPVDGSWRLAMDVLEASRARLDETALQPLRATRHSVAFTAAPHEIVTVLVRVR